MPIQKPTRSTHDVFNQSAPYAGINAYLADPILSEVGREMPQALRDGFSSIGKFVTTPEAQELARIANQSTPQLKTFDSRGNRIDEVEFHPAYHALMRRSCAIGLHSSIWENVPDEKGIAYRARGIRFFLTAGLECGHLCPITMTSASMASIKTNPAVEVNWAPKILSRKYDSSQRPASQKSGVTIGMGMTEKQGGTDVRVNTSTALKASEGIYRLTGHKWFMSAPMSDAFLMLAQMEEGLGCFLVPRFLQDGERNGLQFQRLKDKLGNRSNASSEVEFINSYGYLLGEPGKGVRTILEMVTLTRLDCALASAGIMRASLAEAVHHCRGRKVFGQMLVDQPLMTRVLADMALDVARGHSAGHCDWLPLSIALPGRSATGGLCARHDPGDQILDLQDGAAADLRGDGVSRRQRLRRRAGSGKTLPRSSGQCDLGRVGQCHGTRSGACLAQ